MRMSKKQTNSSKKKVLLIVLLVVLVPIVVFFSYRFISNKLDEAKTNKMGNAINEVNK